MRLSEIENAIPQYPASWDEPEIILCAACGIQMDGASLDNEDSLCEKCEKRLEESPPLAGDGPEW